MLVMPPQRVDDLVVLLDAAQLLQVGGLENINAPDERDEKTSERGQFPGKQATFDMFTL